MSDLSDTKHGSAAGSVPRTSDDAAQGASRHVSLLGLETIINEDIAGPPGKRRVVSREPPAPPLGVMLQAAGDTGAADRSLDLSSDDSMPGGLGVLPSRGVSQQRPAPRSRPFGGSPRVRAHLP